jgi:hypothetical protein
MRQQLFASALVALIVAGPAAAQHVPETDPRPGEQRFNAFIYKASHNSYERSEPLDEQIDVYNVWQLELDMQWEGSGCDITVDHYCGSLHDAQSLTEEIAASRTAAQRFTVIYMETKNPDNNICYEDWPERSVYRQCLYDTFDAVLGADRVYSVGEFETVDLFRWPSRPELLRRGKHFIVILDEQEIGGPFDDDFFFATTNQNPPSASMPDSTVLASIDAGCDIDSVDFGPALVNERWLYRAWPGAACSEWCELHDGNYWDNAVAFGYNLIATNCVSDDHTFSPATHSPQPLFVNPSGKPDAQYGTLGFPYIGAAGVIAGVDRASPMVDVVIGGGTYDVTGARQGSYAIDRPVVLTARPSSEGQSAVLR